MSDEKKPFNNPFGALGALKQSLPQGRSPEQSARAAFQPSTAAGQRAAAKGPAKAVVRMERVGRGGKEVTVIEQLDLPVSQRDEWLKALKTSLGCGGTIEGTSLVLQGDQRERVPALLEKRGVKKVVVG